MRQKSAIKKLIIANQQRLKDQSTSTQRTTGDPKNAKESGRKQALKDFKEAQAGKIIDIQRRRRVRFSVEYRIRYLQGYFDYLDNERRDPERTLIKRTDEDKIPIARKYQYIQQSQKRSAKFFSAKTVVISQDSTTTAVERLMVTPTRMKTNKFIEFWELMALNTSQEQMSSPCVDDAVDREESADITSLKLG